MEWKNVGLISYIVLWVIVVIQAFLTLALARLVGQLMSRRMPGAGARVIDPGPEIGVSIEGWEASDLFGRTANVRFPGERGVFLLYVSPHCSTCAMLLPSAKRFFKEIAAEAEGSWVMALGSRETQVEYARENRLTEHLVFAEEELPNFLHLGGAPFGIWINAAGEVRAKGMVNTREHLESLRLAVRMGHSSIQSYISSLAEDEEQRREQSVSAGVDSRTQKEKANVQAEEVV